MKKKKTTTSPTCFYEQAHILVACHNPAVFCSDTNTGFLSTNSGRSGN